MPSSIRKYRYERNNNVSPSLPRFVILISFLINVEINSTNSFVAAFAPPPSVYLGRRPTSSSTICNDLPTRSTTNRGVTLKASPSGIDEWPQMAQAGVFVGSYLTLGVATYPTTKLLEALSTYIGLERWRGGFINSVLPLTLGLMYATAGVGHFTNADAFRDIYPPIGTWGIWYLPGSAAFHVAWTGAVEALGGVGLIFGGIRGILSLRDDGDADDDGNFAVNLIQPASALALLVLTVLVTPANIYMFTHGATMGNMGPLDVSFHYIRFAVQVALLSLLLTLAKDSFFFAWGDELD
mmetsp:Transcript_29527/g.48724  ORF Transcript_29527/g.48724 Transcript_29527/m.48724 type:complete len:296 (+) Transcript_29527:62-949(+)